MFSWWVGKTATWWRRAARRLPDDEMAALGEVSFGWTVDSECVVPRLDWLGIVKDIDARGYSIVPHGDVGGLLGLPQHGLSAFYPEFHQRCAA